MVRMSISKAQTAVQQVDAAIAAHSRWKFRLKELVESGRTDIDSATATRDDLCRLGKWLQSYEPMAIERGIYREVCTRHTSFHRAIGDVLQLATAGRRKDAEASMEIGSAFSKLSSELIASLMEWRQLIR